MRHNWRVVVLLAFSAAVACLSIIGRPYILYNDGDPLTYFRKAWWYIGHVGGMDVPSRGPGYPIWLILTGAAPFETWWLLVASHIAMAVAAPVLIYGILAPMSRNAGFVAGLLFMAFAVSYQHMHWVMTEELFLFVELVSFLLIARYLCGGWGPLPAQETGSRRWRRAWNRFQGWLRTPYAIALALAYATMVKPAASPFFWLFVLVCLLFRVGPWKRHVGPVFLYVAIMTAWGTFDYFNSPVRFPPLGMPQSSVQRNFADVYYSRGFAAVNGWRPITSSDPSNPRPGQDSSPAEGVPASIQPQSGPASQRLYELVADLVAKQRASGQWNVDNAESARQLYGRYGSNEELVGLIFARPNPTYFQFILQAAAGGGGDRLIRDVAREHGHGGLSAFLSYLGRHPTLPLKGPPNSYVGYHFFSKFYRYREFLTTGQAGMRDLFIRGLRDNLVNEEYGDASRAFINSIRFFMSAYPQYLSIGEDYVADFGGRENFIQYILENPYHHPKYTGSMMGWIFQWLMLLYGEEPASDLMARAATEIVFSHRAAPDILVGDYLAAVAYSGDTYFSVGGLLQNFRENFKGLTPVTESWLIGTVESGRANQLPVSMKWAVGHVRPRSELSKALNTLQEIHYGAFKWVKPILFVLTIVFALPLILFSAGGRLVTFLVLCFFVSAAAWVAAMIMPGSDPRHEDVYAFIPLLVSVLGLARLPMFTRWSSTALAAHAGSVGASRRRSVVSAP